MTHFGTALAVDPMRDVIPFGDHVTTIHHSVLMVSDADEHDEFLKVICEFLDVGLEYASSRDDLGKMLARLRPMAVITELEGAVQDGFHVMKTVAECDPSVPVLLFTSNDLTLLGAVDAVRELWGLGHVATMTAADGIGPLVDFICQAARGAGMPRLMRG